MIQLGLKGHKEYTVSPDDTAQKVGSGTLEVLATPRLIAFIEETAWQSIQPFLDQGVGSVGTRIDIQHLSPTPVGMKVNCLTEVIKIKGREIVFKCECVDEKSKIAEGIHHRFLVQSEKFQAKANTK